MTPATSQLLIPHDLKATLPSPLMPWRLHFDLFNRVSQQGISGKNCKTCDVLPGDPEHQFILKYFMQNKPANYGIKRIICIHNPAQTMAFEAGLRTIEGECKEETYSPGWQREGLSAERSKVVERWKSFTEQFSPLEVPNINGKERTDSIVKAKVLPLWHGSKKEKCETVCESGFTFFGKHHYFDPSIPQGESSSTDVGYFGSGIYFTNSAKYAAMYSRGHLIFSWVSMREPYPVVSDVANPSKGDDIADIRKLMGQGPYTRPGHYQNYNAHFIPVRAKSVGSIEYYPCYRDQNPEWDEIVVFEKAQTLPRFWVELGVDSPQSLTPASTTEEEYQNGLNYTKEPRTDQKLQQAFLCFKNAAEKGHPSAQYELANCYYNGQGVSQSYEEACKWYQRAHLIAQNQLSKLQTELQAICNNLATLQGKTVSSNIYSTTTQAQELKRPKIPSIAFGKEKWEKFIGEIGEEPPLPPNIHEILTAPCPFWPDKKVEETHMLVLIPQSVKDYRLNLGNLFVGYRAPDPKSYSDGVEYNPNLTVIVNSQLSSYSHLALGEYADFASPRSHWVLMTRSIIPNSRGKNFEDQKNLIIEYNQKAQVSYQVPSILDAATCILMEFLQAKITYQGYTTCQERYDGKSHLVIGGFILNNRSDVYGQKTNQSYQIVINPSHEGIGIAALRNL